MTRTCVHWLLAFLVLTAMSSQLQAAGGKKNPAVHPPGAQYRGMTSGEWAATWWQTVLDIPIVDGDHPLISGGAFEGPKGVLFLAGVFSAAPAVVEITIRPGTPLFFPVINAECSEFEPDPFHGEGEAELRACANEHLDNTSDIFAVVDGKPVTDLEAFRTETPLFTWGPLPADNIFGAPEGTTSLAVDAGYYLLLQPLSVGTHVVEFGGTFDELGGGINTRYIITVSPK